MTKKEKEKFTLVGIKEDIYKVRVIQYITFKMKRQITYHLGHYIRIAEMRRIGKENFIYGSKNVNE